MSDPYFIVGPTAVGKTSIAVAAAERCGAEIVNADAFQVYAGFDLLTAKPSAAERGRVPHHLIGTVPTCHSYSVAQYQKEARRCLDEIARRKRPVIVVGGSGLYVKSLTHGLSALPPAQPALRAELEQSSLADLLQRLRELDPVSAATIDGANRRRVIRAVEVCLVTGERFSDFREAWYSPAQKPDIVGVYLERPKADQDARIERRVESMFSHGLIEEVQAVRSDDVAGTAARMIGWRQIQDYLQGRLGRQECAEKIETATRQYAKRQRTWFKSESVFEKVSLHGDEDVSRVVSNIVGRILSTAPGM